MSSKFTSTPIDDSDGLVRYIKEHCTKYTRLTPCDVWISPSNAAFPSIFLKHVDRIHNMEVRPDDIWVITFPKSGTTWTQEMVWLLKNNCNFELAKRLTLVERFPFMELNALEVSRDPSKISSLEQTENMKSPRFIKTHLPYELLPHQLWTVKPKIIYTCRNPLSAALSYYHHYRAFNAYDGDLEHFLQAFLANKIGFGPYWKHVLDFWQLRNEPNIYFNCYEDMKDDLENVLEKVARFLSIELDKSKIPALKDHLSFTSMKNNAMINMETTIKNEYKQDPVSCPFIRRGEKDDWKDSVPLEFIDKFKQWNEKSKQGSDFYRY